MAEEEIKLPKPFVLRRLHSLLGMWLVIYLFEHLLVNSQAALFFYNESSGFISMVNKLENLPYLPIIEIVFLGLPFLIHGIWGVIYLRNAKLNAHNTDGSSPALKQYPRNRAFSWQRITAVVLIFFIILHVIQMRFLESPKAGGIESDYMVWLDFDAGLDDVANKLGVKLYDSSQIEMRKKGEKESRWVKTAEKRKLKENQVLAVAPTPGAAFYLMLRQTFKSPIMVILYSIFVIAATYHAFNGMWTFMIKWGIALSTHAQRRMRTITNVLMAITTIMGLMAVWGTYWTVQFQV